MEGVYLILFFILGTILGSFYNVVGYRLPLEISISKGRSKCPHCLHELSWYELVPILSFLIQKGRCRACHKKIALFYPLVELATGILFAISYYSFGFTYDLGISLCIISLFMIIIVSDLTYYIIPDEVLVVFGVLILIFQYLKGSYMGLFSSLGSGLFLFFVMFLMMKLGYLLFKKESLGGGDVKLMLITGFVLPPLPGVIVIFLSSLIALPISIFLLLRKKEHMIPYGPFILLALILIYLMKIDFSGMM